MISYIDTKIKACVLHKVGNKLRNEGCIFSNSLFTKYDAITNFLIEYFFASFKQNSYYSLCHNIDITMNEVYVCASKIFENPESILDQSLNMAKHLYEQSIHPKVKGGEFYVVYFKDCIVDYSKVDAIGLFKSENKDTFLKVYHKGEGFEIESERGVNINKLDKGCLIFNTEKESGYLVAIVDNTNKGAEAKYWTDEFLHVRLRKDSYNQTQNMLSLCKNFVAQLPTDNGKLEKATYINRSLDALKDDTVNVNTFAERVFEKPELISEFRQYKDNYQRQLDVDIDDDFKTAPKAVNHRSTGNMTTIRLDNSFDINIHGGEQNIIRGYDEERGMYYYQLFFKEER